MPAPLAPLAVMASLKLTASEVSPATTVPPVSEGVVLATTGSTTPTLLVSVAVSLEVFCSPPPETVAVLVTLAGQFSSTLTVSVSAA